MDLNIDQPSAPYNGTKVGWMNGPNGRGTLSILVSCMSSLFLSSWAVMHLNILSKKSSTARQLATYFYWCIYGIIGPELVIWAAWRQLLSAWALRDELRKELPNSSWTVSHGFYALMGGFVIDLDRTAGIGEPAFTTGIRRLTLTPRGLLLLARCGHLPDVLKEEIMDKSKTDELGKLLACIQVTWMIVQVCSRLSLHLPVTTLEVTAVAHVLCALVLYALWWHKPRKVDEPTVLTGDWLRPLAAFMLMCSRESQGQMLPGFQLNGEESEIAGLKLFPQVSSNNASGLQQEHFVFFRKFSIHAMVSTSEKHSIRIDPLPRTGYNRPESQQGSTTAVLPPNMSEKDVDDVTKARWMLAQQAIQQYPAVRGLLRPPYNEVNRKFYTALEQYPEMPTVVRSKSHEAQAEAVKAFWLECNTQDMVTVIASNWPHDGLLRTANGLWTGAILWFVSIAYSSINIAAWSAAFPTMAEAWLWRSASSYIAFSGLFWAGLHVAAIFSARLWWTWYDIMNRDASAWLTRLVHAVCGICGAAYLFSRTYLIAEAFVGLRFLPKAAYEVPGWTLGVPHIA